MKIGGTIHADNIRVSFQGRDNLFRNFFPPWPVCSYETASECQDAHVCCVRKGQYKGE